MGVGGGDFLAEKFEGLEIWPQKFEGPNAMAPWPGTPRGRGSRRAKAGQGALSNYWTTQSYQGVWGPCVSAWMTGTQGLDGVGEGVLGMILILGQGP